MYLHMTLTRSADRVAPRHDLTSHCLQTWGGGEPICNLFIGSFFFFSHVALEATVHFYLDVPILRSRVSVVGIATGYELYESEFESR
jgi:hypothetical protein